LLGQTRLQPAVAHTAGAQRAPAAPRHAVCVGVDAPKLLDEFRALFATPASPSTPR